MKLLTLSDLKHFWTNAVQKIPIKISDLQDDVDMLTSHEDLHLEDLPNDSPNIIFENNTPSYTWREMPHGDLIDWSYFGNPYDQELTFLTSSSKIIYKNNSNSQNTCELAFGQSKVETKTILTMNYYYGSNDTNEPDDDSNYVSSSLVFTLSPGYNNFASPTFDETEYSYSDVSPDGDNYYLGRKNPFKAICAKDFMFESEGNYFSLMSTLEEMYGSLGTHIADTDIHVTSSDKTSWNTVTSKANDSDVVHKTGDETIAGVKTFSDDTYIKSLNFTSEVASQSSSGGSTLPLIATVTYTGQTESKSARINLRISANGTKTFYPHENNQYSLGTASKKWSEVRAYQYYYGSSDIEFSDKFVTTDTTQTISGVKSFSNDTYITSLNFTNNVASPSSSSSSVMPIINTVTYTSGDTSVVARLNFRVTANGDKSLYPHENNQYYLGLTSRKWKEIHATEYYYGSSDTEFSSKFVTTDTAQTISGAKTLTDILTGTALDCTRVRSKSDPQAYIVFRQNDQALPGSIVIRASDGTGTSLHIAGGSFRSYTDNTVSLGTSSYKWTNVATNAINGLNPSSLSMPDLANGIDISSYITTGDTDNNYTPSVNGWIWIRLIGNGASIIQGDFGINSSYVTNNLTSEKWVETNLFVTKNVQSIIRCRGITGIVSAYFYPCLGNV